MTSLFSHLVHKHLVYTVSWEDWDIDNFALKVGPEDCVLMITGGGCNVLNCYLSGAGHVHAIDLNPCQSSLLELKLAASSSLNFADFFAMFGDGLHPKFRQLYNERLRTKLSQVARDFWDGHSNCFSNGLWRRSFHHHGTAGLAYKLLLEARRLWPRLGPQLDSLFSCETMQEQVNAYRTLNLHQKLNTPLFRAMLHSQTLMSLMAIPPVQFHQIDGRYPGGMPGFALDCIDNVFTRTLLKENYFWQVAWFGYFTATSCPAYLKEENYHAMAVAAESISIHTGTLENYLSTSSDRFNKYVLLDHMDWLAASGSGELSREWAGIMRTAYPEAQVIFRTAGPDAPYLDDLLIEVNGRLEKFHDCVHFDCRLAAELHCRDRVCIYGNYYIGTLGVPV